MLKNERGIITISFLLVLVIILFFILSFFGLAMTFAHISVSQYLSYSTARKYSLAGGQGQPEQKARAEEHYEKLRSWFFKPNVFVEGSDDWFIIPASIEESAGDSIGAVFSVDDGETYRNLFYGVGFKFTSHIPEWRIPLLMERKGPYLNMAGIFSFLGREPSHTECQGVNFNQERGNKIEAEYGSLPNFDGRAINDAGVGDNGC